MTGAEGGARYAAVAVPIPVRRLFTYRVEPGDGSGLERGARVRVPLGRRRIEGTVVEFPAEPPEDHVETRAIDAVLPTRSLPADLLDLTRFVADYYLCSWGEAIDAALPPDPGPRPTRQMIRRLPAAKPDELSTRATSLRALLEALPADGTEREVRSLPPAARRAVRALRERGWVHVEERGVSPEGRPENPPPLRVEPGLEPTAAQARVLESLREALEAGCYGTYLLFGATGSGKTEVYLRAAERCLRGGRHVIYLVPEIGLTPLLLGKVERRFPGLVAMLHSGLSARARAETWNAVRQGRFPLVIGTRSALFAPVPRLGLVVVDEEQDGSYKQEETPRYNARDLAVVRAREAGALVLLGSATPSMESFHHARSGRYTLLPLGGRIQERPLPEVERVDMREEFVQSGEVVPVSRRLAEALRECVERGEQAIVLRNRRGWAAAVLCPRCGERVSCRRCSVALTWHRSVRRLRCHYCGIEERLPDACPRCSYEELDLRGEGTEKIEDLIREVVPEARVERMDRDTIRRRGAQESLLRRFDDGEIDVLVGTQMVAKGHDFPRVTLVGVLSADQPLGLPDYRAAERVFQLMTQVAGRAGRGERPGRVVVQAFDPDHPVLRQAARQDFEAFYEREIRYRRSLRYPPLAALVQLLVQDREPLNARMWAEKLARALEETGQGRLLLGGPGPAPIERLRGQWRQQLLVRTSGRRRLIEAVREALDRVEGEVPRRALTVDVDPYSLL